LCVRPAVCLSLCLYIQEFLRHSPPVSFFRPLSSSFLISFNLQCQQRLTFDCKTTHTQHSTAQILSVYCIYFFSRSYQAAVPRIETLLAVPLQNCQLIKRNQLATYVGNGNGNGIQNRNRNKNKIQPRNEIRFDSQSQPWTWTTPHNSWGILGLSVQLRDKSRSFDLKNPATHI